MHNINIRKAISADLPFINIYNQGIEDRIATLEQDLKEMSDIEISVSGTSRGAILSLWPKSKGEIVGWASLNPYSHRCAYQGVADLCLC